MNVSRGDNRVLAMDVVRPDTELLVVTENGYGKRTAIEEYPVKGRGSMGVKTIGADREEGRRRRRADRARAPRPRLHLAERDGAAHAACKGISKQGRPSQGVRVMNLRDDDMVSAVALVMETNTSAEIQGDLGDDGEELLSDVPAVEGEDTEPTPVAEFDPDPEEDEPAEEDDDLDDDDSDDEDESDDDDDGDDLDDE